MTLAFTSARRRLNAARNVELAGYSGAARLAENVHDPLEANVLVLFEDGTPAAAFISVDALFVGRAVTDECLALLSSFGLPPERVIITASHTHFAPSLDAHTPRLGRLDPSFQSAAISAIREATTEAISASPLATMMARGTACADHAVNRRKLWPAPRLTRRGVVRNSLLLAPNAGGPKNEIVTALVFSNGERRTIVWHYTCHPVGLPLKNSLSAEFPGRVRTELRSRFGDQTDVIFLQGFAGDIRPKNTARRVSLLERAESLVRGPSFKAMTLAEWDEWADSLADVVVHAVLAAAPISQIKIAAREASCHLDTLLPGAGPRRVEMQRLTFGNALGLLAVSAEALIGLSELNLPECTLPVGYSRDVFGYWPRTFQLAQGGYEVDGFKEPFSVEYPWTSDPDAVFADLYRRCSGDDEATR